MDQKVIKRKNITVSYSIVASTEEKFNLILDFQPDEMNVKMITCAANWIAADRVAGVVNLYCATINETLGSFHDGSVVYPNLTFLAKNYPVNTQWIFKILDVGTGNMSTTFNQKLSFHLEFIKYG